MEAPAITLFKCKGKCGLMKPQEDFPRKGPYKGRYYRHFRCKQCTNRIKWRLRRVPLTVVRPHLLEIVHRTGSQRAAAAALGVKPTTIRQWLGLAYRYRSDGSRKKAHAVSRHSAAHILNTLRHLRANDVYYDHGNRNGTKPYWFKVDARDAEYSKRKRERTKKAA